MADRTELTKLVGFFMPSMMITMGGILAQSQALVSRGARDLQQTPRANCVVSYRKNETKVSPLDGKVACELSKHLYGVDQWWVLLKKKA